jgi:hypothetical protein
MLVLIGATPEGKKELVGFQVGMRESAQSWRELLVDLKARGLTIAPELATGDGALGFWKALEEVSPTTRHQRCTVHKTVNVLDKLPKSVQPAAIGLCPIPRRDVSKASMMGRWTSIHACSPSGNKRDVSGCCGTQVVQVAQRRHRVPKDPMLVLVPKHALVRHLVAGLMLPSAVGTGGRCIMPSEEVGAPI